MLNYSFVVEQIRFHLTNKNCILFTGWYRDDNPENRTLKVFLGEKEVPVEYVVNEGSDIRRKYLKYEANIGQEILGSFELPEDWNRTGKLKLVCDGEEVYSISSRELIKLKYQIPFKIESDMVQGGKVRIIGWAAADDMVDFSIKQGSKQLDLQIKREKRPDVDVSFPELTDSDRLLGFDITSQVSGNSWMVLKLTSGGLRSEYTVYTGKTAKLKKMRDKYVGYRTRNGRDAAMERLLTKLKSEDHGKNDYDPEWQKVYGYTQKELDAQRKVQFRRNIKFSVVVPLYNTNEGFLREMIESVISQTYPNWELCMADGSGCDSKLGEILKEYAAGDSRIKYVTLDENKGISGNTNAAIDLADGEYIVLVDHDDIITPNALCECATAIEADDLIEVIYTDEDKIDLNGKQYFDPNIKPDFNIDLLRSKNYICHLFVMKKSLMDRIATEDGRFFRSEFDGSQDYDIIFRCCEKAEKIHHINRILYHWRESMDSTAANPDSKIYAFEAGKRAVDDHYRRMGISAHAEHGLFYGIYNTTYEMDDKPLVTAAIGSGRNDIAGKTYRSLERTTYENVEVIELGNVSLNGGLGIELKDIIADAKGEYILFLDSDVVFINKDAIEKMAGVLNREDVGVVGARIYNRDDEIVHAGIVIGKDSKPVYFAKGTPRTDKGYRSRIVCAVDYDAVDGSCLMVKKSILTGLLDSAAAQPGYIDNLSLCRRAKELGLLVVYQPLAEARKCV